MQAGQQRLTFNVQETHVQISGQAVLHTAVDNKLVKFGQQAVAQAVAQTRDAATLFCHLLLCDFARFAETNNAGNIQRAGAKAAFMASSINHRDKPHIRVMADIKCAAAFRPIKFVQGERSQIDFGVNNIQRNFAQVHCTASEWKSTPCSRQSLPISSTGWSTPVSLFAAMMLTRMVQIGEGVFQLDLDRFVRHSQRADR